MSRYTVTRCECGRFTVNGVPCPSVAPVAAHTGVPPRKRGDGVSETGLAPGAEPGRRRRTKTGTAGTAA
jgi:hypothetical protein